MPRPVYSKLAGSGAAAMTAWPKTIKADASCTWDQIGGHSKHLDRPAKPAYAVGQSCHTSPRP